MPDPLFSSPDLTGHALSPPLNSPHAVLSQANVPSHKRNHSAEHSATSSPVSTFAASTSSTPRTPFAQEDRPAKKQRSVSFSPIFSPSPYSGVVRKITAKQSSTPLLRGFTNSSAFDVAQLGIDLRLIALTKYSVTGAMLSPGDWPMIHPVERSHNFAVLCGSSIQKIVEAVELKRYKIFWQASDIMCFKCGIPHWNDTANSRALCLDHAGRQIVIEAALSTLMFELGHLDSSREQFEEGFRKWAASRDVFQHVDVIPMLNITNIGNLVASLSTTLSVPKLLGQGATTLKVSLAFAIAMAGLQK